MKNYSKPNSTSWFGRKSDSALYLHEKVELMALGKLPAEPVTKGIALLGYACDEGVVRNQGRPGTSKGPEAIRQMLGKLPNHLGDGVRLFDLGTVGCTDGDLETAQDDMSNAVHQLLRYGLVPVLIGGGHDMAYAHFRGIRRYLGNKERIGIINFDAHFDLRSNNNGNNSGTPFYQIAGDESSEGRPFDYLCLGIRSDANDLQLFETADTLGVHYMMREEFCMLELTSVQMILLSFMDRADHIYVTIDLDGFSTAWAPGVSAPSPMGFSPDIVLEALKVIVDSGKLISLDIAELNPEYDRDHQTARLAASLIHAIIHHKNLF